MTNFWDVFYQQPLENIPWHKTQADYFEQLVDGGVVTGEVALDLGCGVGAKSVYLAQHGFVKVIGIDIAKRAIEYASQAAADNKVTDKCTFFTHDATDLSFLDQSLQFDLILDWAVLHCVPAVDRKKYVAGILDRLKPGGHLLLRVFASENGTNSFTETLGNQSETVSIFTKSEIIDLFNPLKLIDSNTSQPRTKKDLYFFEALFQK